MPETPKTAVVTGASSGIGAATVRLLAARGWRVIAAARRIDKLEQLAKETRAEPVQLDITDAEAVAQFADSLDAVHLLVNNAGGAYGLEPIENADVDNWRKMYELNVIGTLQVVRALIPKLRVAKPSDIVTITSTAAQRPYENGAGYVASKHAERAIIETLRLELNGERIRVIEIAPGMVKTDEFTLKRYEGDQERTDALYEGVDEPLVAEDIAQCIDAVISLPHHVNVDTMTVRSLAQAAQHKLHLGPLG